MQRTIRRMIQIITLVAVFAAPLAAAPPQKTHHPHGAYLNILGKKIWYESAGHGEPLLLIPGGVGGSHDYYHPYFSALEHKYRVIYYDGFGRGNSERAQSPSEYTVEHDLDEIEALRQALHLGKIIVFGHSYGGFVAQGYALKYPQSVSKLIVANIFASAQDYQASEDFDYELMKFYFPEAWQQISELRAQGKLANSPEIQQASSPYFLPLMEVQYFSDPHNARFIAPLWNEHNFNAEEYYWLVGPDADFTVAGDIGKLDFRAQLSSIRVPFLVVAGRRDGVVLPRFTTQFTKYAPQAKFVMFEHSGHYPFIEENPLFIQTIEEFLH